VREELAQTQESLNINALLDKAFSTKDGAPNMIIRNATPELERLTNEMLATLMGGRYQVHFLLTQEGKSTSTEQSVFKVKVYDMGRERSIRTCSGAERFIINLAIRRAMGKFLTSRAGSEVRMFVLDEGIGCTDAKNKEAIVSALLQVASDFDCMFVVTHLEDLKSEFPQRLEIKNTPTGSCAELVS
jgi:exonuclease SbcC